ncbi:hypothetical protein RUMOBE_02364 [Blautia obeum ATCC 29174]|uniref:DUF4340 domain-containing protein n=1 Tax=Blautia obeum ATCC 29174 TaxID=411459 RepID=A5ZTN5_9FIRM|nr:DUF4340 domain-containing protein [Blautia obeum]EDM86956.1 hypothetical protein RUMOBE_02364 [Blautia obeum ATCC 29174]RGS13525.1 DUF4340 domain-containing protein [Blautia obeum]RGY07308.1 DUF4340 domain-containing protein [Blautia obeum]UWO13775.1 DUF4340 domain-containing protein [Blautia obeum ATCC 29174]
MKKKTVKLVSAVVVLGVLCAAYEGVNFYVTSQEEKETEENDTSVDLVSLEADDITAVSFTADQNEVEFDKKDDSWTEKSDANFPVNQDTVDSAVKGVASLTADQEISDVEDMSQYDLDSPQNTITLTTADGDTTLEVGMESSNNQYYVKKADDDNNVYLVSSTSIEPFMGTLYDFAESGTFPSVTSATITDVKVDKENSYELTQDADNLFWNVSDGKTTEKADTTKAGTVTSAVGSLAYDKFVDYNCTDDSKYGFDDPYAVITVKYTEDEQETQKVEKTLTIYVGDETGDDRYVKVDDSKEVYTITKDSLTDILDSTMSDFYNLTVSYVSVNDLDSLEVQSADGDHTINIVTETVKAEDEDTTDTDSSDESSSDDEEETTTTTYKLDGEDLDESTFTTFYNKLINMTAQERLTEEYTPEGDPAYIFIFKDKDGKETTVKYYEYDTNFYAAVVEDKVYLVNKMNVKDLDEAYQKMVNPDTEDAEESTSDTVTEEN